MGPQGRETALGRQKPGMTAGKLGSAGGKTPRSGAGSSRRTTSRHHAPWPYHAARGSGWPREGREPYPGNPTSCRPPHARTAIPQRGHAAAFVRIWQRMGARKQMGILPRHDPVAEPGRLPIGEGKSYSLQAGPRTKRRICPPKRVPLALPGFPRYPRSPDELGYGWNA